MLPHPSSAARAANSAHSVGAPVSTSSLCRPLVAADRQGPEPSAYWTSSSRSARSPLEATVVGRPRSTIVTEVTGVLGRTCAASARHPLEDRVERVLGEREPSEFVEGGLAGDRVVVGRIHVLRSVWRGTGTCRRAYRDPVVFQGPGREGPESLHRTPAV